MKTGLVLEGGSMRGLYTAGIIDTFMDEDIKIDGIVGTSAGAVFGANYFSKQRGRVLRYNVRYCKSLRYMSIPSFLLTGNIVNRNFAFYDVTLKYDIFDNETFIKNNTGYRAAVTNIETGKPEYIEITDVLAQLEVLRATSAIPFVSKPVEIDGKLYLDGGVSDSIPYKNCMESGYDKIITVLTQPEGYRKKPMSDTVMRFVERKYKNYPNLVEAIKNRYVDYNNATDEISELEKSGRMFVFRPPSRLDVKHVERSAKKLRAAYELGREDCLRRLDELKEYLKNQ